MAGEDESVHEQGTVETETTSTTNVTMSREKDRHGRKIRKHMPGYHTARQSLQ